MSIEEVLAEIVKNAVHEALTDVRAQLGGIEEKVRNIGLRVNEMSEDTGTARAADIAEVRDAVNYLTEQLDEQERHNDLEIGRAELRLARAAGRVA